MLCLEAGGNGDPGANTALATDPSARTVKSTCGSPRTACTGGLIVFAYKPGAVAWRPSLISTHRVP